MTTRPPPAETALAPVPVNDHDVRSEPMAPGSKPAGIRRQALTLGLDLVAPVVLYYGLHAAGASNLIALVVAAAVPGIAAVTKIARTHEVDRLALLVIATMAASVGISFITGSTRFLLAKDGLLTGAWGLWFLVSVRAGRPAAFLFTRPLLEGRRAFTAESWENLWQRKPAFRRIWRVSSVVWGIGLTADAVIRVVMAYTLPIAVVPALGGALYPVTFVIVQVITNTYYYRAGLWGILDARWARRPSRLSP